MWVKFLADHDFRLPSSTTAYKAGWTGNVTRACADAAIAAGKAVMVKTPSKADVPDGVGGDDGQTTE